jgi:small subunit ribosomal protein S24e
MSRQAEEVQAQLLSDVGNPLLERREVKMLFRGAAGRLSRIEARRAIAKALGLEEQKVVLIGMRGLTGSRDLVAEAYVYDDEKLARLQLPRYVWLRNMPKEERRKVLEEMRKKRAELKAKEAQK